MCKYIITTKMNSFRKNKTRRNKSGVKTTKLKKKYDSTVLDRIMTTFLEMLNIVKIYHWNTSSYSQHKATDELYASLNISVDEFIEVMLGKEDPKVHLVDHRAKLIDLKSSEHLKDKIHEYRSFLIDLSIHFSDGDDSDLLSIRDDILIQLNKFLYLMTLS